MTDAHIDPAASEHPLRALIVEARFYEPLSDNLAAGALQALEQAGASVERVAVPGALEIPPTIRLAADTEKYDLYVALGCIIRGETYHFEIVANESAHGLMALSIDRKLAIGNGILTCETQAQAQARADPSRKNKGGEAAIAAIRMALLKWQFAV